MSQDKFDPMTIPMRMIILLHEFSHFFVNKNIEDETEADLNGLIIYLSLGYPKKEADDSFSEAFYGADTPQNRERYQIITQFINDFSNSKTLVF